MRRSKKPRKQRKALYCAPLHKRQKLVAVHLSKDLRKSYGKRSLPVRKGDEIKVVRGLHKGKTGKVFDVDLKKLKIYIENFKRRRVSGEEVRVPFDPSNLVLLTPQSDDKKRSNIIERVKKAK